MLENRYGEENEALSNELEMFFSAILNMKVDKHYVIQLPGIEITGIDECKKNKLIHTLREISDIFMFENNSYEEEIKALKNEIENNRILLSENRIKNWHFCGGTSVCMHGRQKSRCKECNGRAYREHRVAKARCTLGCGGSSVCIRKEYCKEGCAGSSICGHGTHKWKCSKKGENKYCQYKKD
jgi:hypothetical protein